MADPDPSRIETINRHLKRARKAAGLGFDENPDQVRFILEEARILAMLEVADALRESQADTEA
jgi:DNA recombination-dependent growth factor C